MSASRNTLEQEHGDYIAVLYDDSIRTNNRVLQYHKKVFTKKPPDERPNLLEMLKFSLYFSGSCLSIQSFVQYYSFPLPVFPIDIFANNYLCLLSRHVLVSLYVCVDHIDNNSKIRDGV